MKFTYLIHRVQSVPSQMVIEHDGETLNVTVETLEVELFDENGQHGTFVQRFRKPSEVAAAKVLYKQGEKIDVQVGAQEAVSEGASQAEEKKLQG